MDKIDKLYEKYYTEMAVVSKVKNTKTPQQRYNEANNIFKQIINQTPNVIKNKSSFFSTPDIQAIGSKATVMFGGSFTFPSEVNGKHYGYYEMEQDLNRQIAKFKSQIKSIGKFSWSPVEINKRTSYADLNNIASVSMLGHIIISQIVAYLYDKNTGKKIKLGTYSSKFDAEDQAGGLYGFAQSGYMDRENPHIYYWSRYGSSQRILKTFKTQEEMRKYYDKLEISIEEIQR